MGKVTYASWVEFFLNTVEATSSGELQLMVALVLILLPVTH